MVERHRKWDALESVVDEPGRRQSPAPQIREVKFGRFDRFGVLRAVAVVRRLPFVSRSLDP